MYPILWETTLWNLLATPWVFHGYPLAISAGFITGVGLCAAGRGTCGLQRWQIFEIALLFFVSGLAGAWLLFVLTRLPDYLAQPTLLLNPWGGGLVWYGGFLGALAAWFWYARRHGLPRARLADFMIPKVALGHGIARLGCWAAGCCFGSPTQAPWGVSFPRTSPPHAAHVRQGLVQAHEAPLPIHPTPLVEVGLEGALALGLTWLAARKRFDGQILLLWMLLYGAGRLVIETLRGDTVRGIYVLSTSQWISVAMILGAAFAWTHLAPNPMRPGGCRSGSDNMTETGITHAPPVTSR